MQQFRAALALFALVAIAVTRPTAADDLSLDDLINSVFTTAAPGKGAPPPTSAPPLPPTPDVGVKVSVFAPPAKEVPNPACLHF